MGSPGEPYDPGPGYQPAPAEGPQHPQQGYPQQYPPPGYGPPPSYGPQYPPQGYPGYPTPGYPVPTYGGPNSGPRCPAQTTTAAVLCYVAAGLVIAAGIFLFIGASVADGISSLNDGGHSLLGAELAIDGVLNMVAGGLLIAGAVILVRGRTNGRILLSVGSGIVIALALYWIIRAESAGVVWALIFAALVIVALSMAWSRSSSRWLSEMAANHQA